MQVPAQIEYERARSVDQAISLLERLGEEARVIAGGHSLLPMMKLRLANPEYLVDINDLHDELGYIRRTDDEVRIGAMTRHREILESELLAQRLQIFTDAERVIADPVVRNRGTIGGALCQADPAEDLSAVCAAVGAQIVIRGRGGERVLGMREFHLGAYETAVGEAEMVTEIRVPLHADAGSAYEKVERRVGDFATAGTAVALEMDGGGRVARAGIALTGVGSTTIDARVAAEAVTGQQLTSEVIDRAAALAAEAAQPSSDHRGSAAYKRHVIHTFVTRILTRVSHRAEEAA